MTDADLQALWSAWFKDRTLHRACNLISAIVREMADCRAAGAPPAAEEPTARVSELMTRMTAAFEAWFRDSGVDFWSETDAPAELAQIAVTELNRLEQPPPKPPQTDTRGERTPLPTGGIVHDYPTDAMPRGLRMAQDDFGRRRTVHLDSGPLRPTNPEDDGA